MSLLNGQHRALRRLGSAWRTNELRPLLAICELNCPDAHELLTSGTDPNRRGRRRIGLEWGHCIFPVTTLRMFVPAGLTRLCKIEQFSG